MILQKEVKRYKMIFIQILLVLSSLLIFVPPLIVFLNAFKSIPEAALFNLVLPKTWHFENFITVFNEVDVFTSLFNGLQYSALTAAGVIVLCSMCSFALARNKRKVYTKVYYFFIIGLVLPFSVIPTIWITKILHVYGTKTGLILLYIALNMPFTIFMYTGFIKTINRELDEAAIIDGCGSNMLFFRIIFPLLKPVTITVALLTGIGIWNEFFLQLYFTSYSKMWGMPISIYKFFSLYSRHWNLVCADIVISSTPIIILFFVFQKYIVTGMVAGAVKG